jgi:FtsP/CotA-like multicopper oxidase with cupredoxin domain
MGMMTEGIEGRRSEMDGDTAPEAVKHDTTEMREFRNDASMTLMAHAMQVPGVQFRVPGRSVAAVLAAARYSDAGGYVDEGWKDTVFIMPGERVRPAHSLQRIHWDVSLSLSHA